MVAFLSATSTHPLLFSTVAEVPESFKRIWVPFRVRASSLSFSSSPFSPPPGFPLLELAMTLLELVATLLELVIALLELAGTLPELATVLLELVTTLPELLRSMPELWLPKSSKPELRPTWPSIPAELSSVPTVPFSGCAMVPLSSEHATMPKAAEMAIAGSFVSFISHSCLFDINIDSNQKMQVILTRISVEK